MAPSWPNAYQPLCHTSRRAREESNRECLKSTRQRAMLRVAHISHISHIIHLPTIARQASNSHGSPAGHHDNKLDALASRDGTKPPGPPLSGGVGRIPWRAERFGAKAIRNRLSGAHFTVAGEHGEKLEFQLVGNWHVSEFRI
jgi:hypothetical protein